MSVCVFAGPTLSRAEVHAVLDCECLPPAGQGDLYHAARRRPRAIGLIDGYFHGVPSVWHKEILWALAEGVHVFGAASMGALRAAELHRYGMRGVGSIFEDYRNGVLEDDDEVALLHGPPETGFATLTEPMVNVRATLARAEAEGAVEPEESVALITLAKTIYYQARTWERLLEAAGQSGLAATARENLAAWLPRGYVDQKRSDARAMLETMREFLADDPPPHESACHFEWTHHWESVASAALPEDSAVLDELRLDAATFRETRHAALLRSLAARDIERGRGATDAGNLRERHNTFRMERGFLTQRALEQWLAANELDAGGLKRLLREDVEIDALLDKHSQALEKHIVAELRLRDQYTELAQRARSKRDRLDARNLADADIGTVDLAPVQLLAWFYEGRLGSEIPEDLDTHVRELGFEDRDDLYRILAREYLYSTEDKKL